MGLIGKMLGTDKVIEGVFGVVDQLVPDGDLRAKLKAEIQGKALSHKSVFVAVLVAGPKPFLMWVAGAGFFIYYIFNPIMTWICFMAGFEGVPVIQIDAQDLYALAGLGSASVWARSYEKKHGVQNKH